MNKRIIMSILALVLALSMAFAFTACNDNTGDGEESTKGNQVILPGDDTDDGTQNGNGGGNTEVGNPGEYSYSDCNETVYVNNPDSAVTLRSAEYEAKGSVPHGTELKRIGLSTDEANYWSKVTYDGETYYVASKFLTDIKDPDAGFVAVDKIVVVNDETGSLNIRNLPTFNGSAIIGWALAGEETKVIAENTETGWYKIEFVAYGGEKMTGYIKSGADNFVQDEKAPADTEAGNNETTASEPESAGK